MKKTNKIQLIALIMIVVFALANVSIVSAADSNHYLSIKQYETKTYNLKTNDTWSSRYVEFTPCKGTVSDYFDTKWESRRMMYSVKIFKTNGKIYKQFTWNANNAKDGKIWKATLERNTKYKVQITAIGCYGQSIKEKYKSTSSMPKLKWSFTRCGLY